MTPEGFEDHLKRLKEEFTDLFDKYALKIAGVVAVQRWVTVWVRNGKTVKKLIKARNSPAKSSPATSGVPLSCKRCSDGGNNRNRSFPNYG